LTIALASVAVGLIVFLANRRLAIRARRAAERAQRISEVVDDYLRYVVVQPPVYEGVWALLLAGVRRLRDNREIQLALDRIEARTAQRPLKDVDVGKPKAFCDEVRVEGPGVVGYNEALTEYGKKS
jgi:hypothetical protein